MTASNFWDKQHQKYSLTDWITKPTFFAKEAINYFPKSGKILDLGAGQAQDSIFFAEMGYKVTSADFSKEAQDLAKKKLPENLKDKIEFKQADLSEKLPFEALSFDVVYRHLALQCSMDEDI